MKQNMSLKSIFKEIKFSHSPKVKNIFKVTVNYICMNFPESLLELIAEKFSQCL